MNKLVYIDACGLIFDSNTEEVGKKFTKFKKNVEFMKEFFEKVQSV